MDSKCSFRVTELVADKRSGMARIFTAAPGLVKVMNGESWDATGLPEVYKMTKERLQRLQSATEEAPKTAIV
jgi:hypothetical protein